MEPEKLDLTSGKMSEDQIKKLKSLFPEVITEGGKVDFEKLKLTLGETIDTGKERYGMNWPGKADCFKTIQQPSMATLVPDKKESIKFDKSKNLVIEGDNLEVLKLLQKSLMAKVKMIYIDPPYNTGGDFIYPDNYSESLETYLEYTGQVDNEGRKFSTNTEADGRFHSKWMNMIYPRLFLARNLLRDDGVIFISIDDHEVDNLKKICNEIFGEENFVANVIWQKKYTRSNDAKYFSDNHDHILVYGKNKDSIVLNLQPRTEEQESAYMNPDNHPKGPWKATPLHAKSGSSKNFKYKFKNGVVWSPPGGTYPRYSTETLKTLDDAKEIWFGSDGKSMPSRKTFLTEAKEGVTPTTIWTYQEVGHNHEANNELKTLGLDGAFDNPKPTKLLKRMLGLTTNNNEHHIVLDFFAGSGTTAQAVLDLNKEDGGNRTFILIQLPEPIDRVGFLKISEITKERIKKVIKKNEDESIGELKFDSKVTKDDGFRFYKLAESNFVEWNSENSTDRQSLESQLELHVQHIRKERSDDDILSEILIKSGFMPSSPLEILKLAEKKVFSLANGMFFICLERKLTLELIRLMADRRPERVVLLDEGFSGNDQLKANAVQIFKTKGIQSFKTI